MNIWKYEMKKLKKWDQRNGYENIESLELYFLFLGIFSDNLKSVASDWPKLQHVIGCLKLENQWRKKLLLLSCQPLELKMNSQKLKNREKGNAYYRLIQWTSDRSIGRLATRFLTLHGEYIKTLNSQWKHSKALTGFVVLNLHEIRKLESVSKILENPGFGS